VTLTHFQSDIIVVKIHAAYCCVMTPADLVDKSEHKGGAAATEGSGTRSRIKDDNKGESQSAEAKGEKVNVFVSLTHF